MYAALFAILAALRKPNSQRGAWMKLFKHSKSYARTSPEISRWGAGFVAILMILAGMAFTTVAQAQATKRTLRCATRLTMATWLGRASWPRDRPWESLAATVTKTCCRRLFIFKEAGWRTAWRRCNIRFAKSLSTART